MKLQNLTIIFIMIVMPIVLVLSAYNKMQIDTIKLQTYYNAKLTEAVYDAVKAYKINTRNSVHETSKKRDIEASNQTLITSLTTALGIGGYGENYVKPYIPAVIYTLYEGFYTYAPTYNYNNNKYEHILKPYNTYSARYKKGTTDIIVSYTLDNYVTIIGTIGGEYVNRSGYLIEENIYTTEEHLEENLLIDGKEERYTYVYNSQENAVGEKRYYEPLLDKWFRYAKGGQKIYLGENLPTSDQNAKQYAEDAKEFTNWVKQNLSNITIQDMIIAEKNYTQLVNEYGVYTGTTKPIFIFNAEENRFEDENSIFNIHKKDVIKIMIQEELRASISEYNKHSGALNVNYNFKVPTLTEDEWHKITTNISITAFMQGLPIGFKTYNNYVTITDTENTDYLTRENLCFVNLDEPNSQYHKIDCPNLTGTNIIGYRKTDFDTSSIEINKQETKYYYKQTNLPCYNCIVNCNYDKEITLTPAKQQAFNNVLARERNILHY